jgi:predicted nucleic acid-binding protein
MRVIVDTSVWSLLLRRRTEQEHPKAEQLRTLLKEGHSIFLIGSILQEVLQGIRGSEEFEKVKASLSAAPMIALQPDDYVAAAEIWNRCRSEGRQVTTVDAQIAAACVRYDCLLLTRDSDFDYIASVSKLELL